jgi:hypothetical protein
MIMALVLGVVGIGLFYHIYSLGTVRGEDEADI